MAFQVSVYLVMVIDLGNSSSRKTPITKIILKVSHDGGVWGERAGRDVAGWLR